MLSLLLNWKIYFIGFALLGIASFAIGQHLKINRLEKANQTCNADLAAKNTAIHLANEMRTRQMEQIRLREQEAAKARVESLKRKERIMQTEIKGGCDGAINWMVEQAN